MVYCICCFLDSFLRNRSSLDHEATAMMKAQFMSLWDGLETGVSIQVCHCLWLNPVCVPFGWR